MSGKRARPLARLPLLTLTLTLCKKCDPMCTYTYYSCLGRVMAESCATFEPVWRAHEASYAACLDQCTDTNNCEQGYWVIV